MQAKPGASLCLRQITTRSMGVLDIWRASLPPRVQVKKILIKTTHGFDLVTKPSCIRLQVVIVVGIILINSH